MFASPEGQPFGQAGRACIANKVKTGSAPRGGLPWRRTTRANVFSLRERLAAHASVSDLAAVAFMELRCCRDLAREQACSNRAGRQLRAAAVSL